MPAQKGPPNPTSSADYGRPSDIFCASHWVPSLYFPFLYPPSLVSHTPHSKSRPSPNTIKLRRQRTTPGRPGIPVHRELDCLRIPRGAEDVLELAVRVDPVASEGDDPDHDSDGGEQTGQRVQDEEARCAIAVAVDFGPIGYKGGGVVAD